MKPSETLRLRVKIFFLFCFLASCSPAPIVNSPAYVLVTANPLASQTPTPFQPMTLATPTIIAPTLIPTMTNTLQPTPLPPTEAPTFPPPEVTSPPPSARTQYLLYATLDYDNKSASVDELIAYTNLTGTSLDNLVLAVEPNFWANSFELASISVDGIIPDYTLSGQRLEISLPAVLEPNHVTTISMTYNLNFPWKGTSEIFGYNSWQINLTNWYPFVVPFQNGAWTLHDPMPFGEHLVYEAADYQVNLKVTNPDSGVIIAASAPPQTNGDWTQYQLYSGRAFVLSASPYFQTAVQNYNGLTLTSYYFAGHEDPGQAVLQNMGAAVNTFSNFFTPYPHASLSVVESDYLDGLEFDGLVFLAQRFYNSYGGGGRNDLTMIGVHELAHQWWFGTTGSDQALEPWLDEALATYSEHIFYETIYPESLNWWWSFRVNQYNPSGYVDTDIYNGGAFRSYTNAVYLNGANFLYEVRGRVGDEVFFAFLKDYSQQTSGRVATSVDFFNILAIHTDADISDIIQNYFLKP